MRGRFATTLALLAALAILGSVVLTGADEAQHVGIRAARSKPDVVLILTDDQRTDTLLAMPSVRQLLVDWGTRFTDAHVHNSLCCPSLSTILTGRYSHDTSVWANGGADGGWKAFVKHGDEQRTIAVALQRAGYRTGLIGKYLNGFADAPPGYDPVAWTDFDGFRVAGASAAYNDYRLGNSRKFYGLDAGDYWRRGR
jgi:N-acetylglucosamine-6-sulfatase